MKKWFKEGICIVCKEKKKLQYGKGKTICGGYYQKDPGVVQLGGGRGKVARASEKVKKLGIGKETAFGTPFETKRFLAKTEDFTSFGKQMDEMFCQSINTMMTLQEQVSAKEKELIKIRGLYEQAKLDFIKQRHQIVQEVDKKVKDRIAEIEAIALQAKEEAAAAEPE